MVFWPPSKNVTTLWNIVVTAWNLPYGFLYCIILPEKSSVDRYRSRQMRRRRFARPLPVDFAREGQLPRSCCLTTWAKAQWKASNVVTTLLLLAEASWRTSKPTVRSTRGEVTPWMTQSCPTSSSLLTKTSADQWGQWQGSWATNLHDIHYKSYAFRRGQFWIRPSKREGWPRPSCCSTGWRRLQQMASSSFRMRKLLTRSENQ